MEILTPRSLEPVLKLARVDFAPRHRQPMARSVVSATILAIGGSLLADAILVAIGTALFPNTQGYVHFRFSDYARLTVPGVLVACAGWPVVTRITSVPRWLFFRLAVLVSLVLFLPDFYLLLRGDSLQAVAVLMTMHVAIALVTYNALVRIARVRKPRRRRTGRTMPQPGATVAMPGATVATPGAAARQPGRTMPQPRRSMPQPDRVVLQPRRNMPQPDRTMPQPGSRSYTGTDR